VKGLPEEEAKGRKAVPGFKFQVSGIKDGLKSQVPG
jgi:hypothetical protein